MLYLHLCGRANGFAPCRIRISGTKNFEAFSSYPCQSGKIAFGRIFDLRYLLHSVNAYLVSCRHVVLENRSTWLFPALLWKLVINYGIDFTGGLSLQYDMGGEFNQADINAALNEMNVGSYTVTEQGTSEVIVRVKEVSEEGVQGLQAAFEAALAEKYPNMTQSGDVSYVGPVAGQTLLYNAFMSVLIASVLMLAYIAIRFDLNSGIAAVLGLVHDVLMMLSFMVLLRSVVQMNSSFIAAMLTIVGYSINNTIVIFDRIRENAKKLSPDMPRVDVVNRSVQECLGRTINTTLTTLITIVLLYILGVDSIREFALPIIVGLLSGVYSANMINGYVWAFLEEKRKTRKAAPKTKTA